MKRLLCFIFTLSTVQALACESAQTFIVEGQEKKLCYYEKGEAWVSSACLAPKACDALKIYEASRKPVEVTVEEASGGKNQSNIICQKLGGTIMMAKIPPRNSQQTFCQGRDKSLIDASALD